MIYRRLKEDLKDSIYLAGDICPLVDDGGRWVLQGRQGRASILSPEQVESLFDAEEISDGAAYEWLLAQNSAATLSPQVMLPGPGAGGDAAASRGLASLQQSGSASDLRNASFAMQEQAGAMMKRLDRASALIESFAGARLREAKKKMAEVQAYAAKLEEVVHTVNLYLGRDEEIACLCEGEPAPASEPISFRARVLFMAEECALDYPGGIDCQQIQFFDQWISKPENLDLVLPEKKGVVVLRVTRESIRYEGFDPYTEALLNAENAKSYWLVRNGDRLHRFWADLDVGDVLFPSPQKIDPAFQHDRERPGTDEFYSRMEHSPASQKHYFKVALTLQGLMDRTLLFHPLPETGKPNLLDPDTYGDSLRFVYDADAALGEGRPTFQEWLAHSNRHLSAGMRVVGVWKGKQVTPKNAYGFRDSEVRILDHDARGFIFQFEPSHSSRKGTYTIDMGKDDILCLDQLKVEDIDYYLRSRETRQSFRDMVPLLQQARAAIMEDDQAEAPFRNLMLRELRQINEAAGEKDVDQMMQWWKTKNRLFRPVIGDHECAAFNEMRQRYRNLAQDGDRVMDAVESFLPGPPLLVWRDGRRVTSLVAQNEELVFVRKLEYDWNPKQGKITPVRESAWNYFPAGVLHEPEILVRDEAQLKAWKIGANHFQHLSGPDVERLKEFLLTRTHSQPLYATRSRSSDGSGEAVSAEMLSRGSLGEGKEPATHNFDILWTRRAKEPVFSLDSRCSRTMWVDRGAVNYPWTHSGKASIPEVGQLWNSPFAEGPRLLYINAELCRETEVYYLDHDRTCQNSRNRDTFIHEQGAGMERLLHAEWEVRERDRYVEQGGNMEFWDSHYKTLKQPVFETEGVAMIVGAVLHKCPPADLADKTWPELVALADIPDPLVKFSAKFRLPRPADAISPLAPAKPEVPSMAGLNAVRPTDEATAVADLTR
jgi:hypothetical protein